MRRVAIVCGLFSLLLAIVGAAQAAADPVLFGDQVLEQTVDSNAGGDTSRPQRPAC